MIQEKKYSEEAGLKHIRAFGQYFTNYKVAEFMCAWACRGAKTMLDPAVGNSVFLRYAQKLNSECSRTGYEIDKKILDYFGNPSASQIRNRDYLLNDWDGKYDAIICNPPYNRFQAVGNRDEIIDEIYRHTGIRFSGYTNLYILFLAKSIFQMSERGRLAYIVPSEFMNSKYGTEIKHLLVEKKLLRAIVNFENDNEMFFNATTTCCILLLDREEKDSVFFFSLKSVDELSLNLLGSDADFAVRVNYCQLSASDKWRSYIKNENAIEYKNLLPVSRFCSVTRGIATGANDYFCFSIKKATEFKIPKRCLTKCICRSADIRTPIFTEADFDALSASDKSVYVLDISESDYEDLKTYIKIGEETGVSKKYLPSCRSPWYSMEQKRIAPIWVSSACRDGIKFVRNLAQTKSLTTFHSVFISDAFSDDTNLIFCYFLTPIAQAIIRENRKELGNGLNKFQPNDLNTAKMLDVRVISVSDRKRISAIYQDLLTQYSYSLVEVLNAIFSSYLK